MPQRTRVIGYRSTCRDGRHVILSDADGTKPRENQIRHYQRKHHLSTGYLFKTENGYHLVFLDKVPFMKAAVTLGTFPWEDKLHATIGAARGDWVLRFTPKGRRKDFPRLISTIKSTKNRHQKSNAHRLFLMKWFGIDIPMDSYFDNRSTINLMYYTIGSD